ncbi:hypothetical protein EOA35_01515, partial [Mesorhizobium sp. M8A.F.Ca.ET.023.01.1.1]
MKKTAGADADLSSPPATLAPLRNRTFRSIWLATQVSSLGWLGLPQFLRVVDAGAQRIMVDLRRLDPEHVQHHLGI